MLYLESPDKQLLWAAENGNFELVKNIIEKDDKLLDVTDKDGYTALHRACYNDYHEIVKVIIIFLFVCICIELFIY